MTKMTRAHVLMAHLGIDENEAEKEVASGQWHDSYLAELATEIGAELIEEAPAPEDNVPTEEDRLYDDPMALDNDVEHQVDDRDQT